MGTAWKQRDAIFQLFTSRIVNNCNTDQLATESKQAMFSSIIFSNRHQKNKHILGSNELILEKKRTYLRAAISEYGEKWMIFFSSNLYMVLLIVGMGPHFMLLLSIYVLYSNVTYISCIMSCGNKIVSNWLINSLCILKTGPMLSSL